MKGANSLSAAGKYASAAKLARIAVIKTQKEYGESDIRTAAILNSLGDFLRRDSRYDTAKSCLESALKICENRPHKDSLTIASIDNNLGILFYELGEFDEAKQYLKSALKVREEKLGSEDTLVAETLAHLGMLYRKLDIFDSAKICQDISLSIRETKLGADDPSIAENLSELGMFYWSEARYDLALPLHIKGKEIREKKLGLDHPDLAISLNSLGITYGNLGKYSKEVSCYQRALEIRRKALGKNHRYVAESLSNLADAYKDLAKVCKAENQTDQAKKLLSEAERLLKEATPITANVFSRRHRNFGFHMLTLADIYMEEGRYGEAKACLDSAYEVWSYLSGSSRFQNIATCVQDQGKLNLRQGFHASAESLLLKARGMWEDILGPTHPLTVDCLGDLALAYRDSGQWDAALDCARKAYDLRHQNFKDCFDVLSEEDALVYSRSVKKKAADYISILWDSPDTCADRSERIADVVFSAKGQVSDGIFERKRSHMPPTDRKLTPLADSVTSARKRYAELVARSEYEAQRDDYLYRLDFAKKEKERLESLFAEKNPDFRRRLELWNIDAKKISQELPDETALVEYLVYEHRLDSAKAESRYLAVVMDKKHGISRLDLGQADPIDSAVSWYRSYFRERTFINESDYPKIARSVYDRIWKPLEGNLINAKMVFIAPDGALNLVSFAGLLDDSEKYLIEKYPIHYLSAGRDLLRLKEESPQGNGLLALGNPFNDLRSSEIEIREIDSLWKELHPQESSTIFLGDGASEENFRDNCQGKHVIHFATHGFFNETVGDNPLLKSGLCLARTDTGTKEQDSLKKDGKLTADEISQLTLEGTELVVLSACETGLGEIESGEGVYGLLRAFQMAGARTIIGALWSVPDTRATVDFMTKLYANETEKDNMAELMKQIAVGQIDSMRGIDRPYCPLIWASFVAVGDWRQP